MGIFSWLFNLKPKKVKLGLALGSGGAKGFAHLGALKAFEENGLNFDYVAGTSIGSIVGAFYADGYTSTDILEMLKKIQFKDINNSLPLGMDGAGITSLIEKSLKTTEIEQLLKPFRAVATRLDNDSEVVFDKGNIAKCLCASSSYPPFFRPVEIDGVLYVDGAFTNSVPADVVKKMGADIVIGIDLRDRESKPSLLKRIFPNAVYSGKESEPWKKGYEFSDIMLHPDLTGYTSTSFFAGLTMYDIGYETAMENMGKIKDIISKFSKKIRR